MSERGASKASAEFAAGPIIGRRDGPTRRGPRKGIAYVERPHRRAVAPKEAVAVGPTLAAYHRHRGAASISGDFDQSRPIQPAGSERGRARRGSGESPSVARHSTGVWTEAISRLHAVELVASGIVRRVDVFPDIARLQEPIGEADRASRPRRASQRSPRGAAHRTTRR